MLFAPDASRDISRANLTVLRACLPRNDHEASRLDIETRTATAATLCPRYTCHLELTSDKLHGVVDLAALQKLQARFVHHYPRTLAVL